jgi:antirestriction protein
MADKHNQPPESGDPGPWDPNDQVGDTYEPEIGPEGVERAEKLGVDHPRIWVGSLSDYNNGILHGEWIDAARQADEVWADINRMLAASPTMAETGEPAEEWGIFDYEKFGNVRVHPVDQIETVARIARGIAEHGLAFAAWADVMEGDDEALKHFEDGYVGHYEDVEAFIEERIDDAGYEQMLDRAVPESLRPYVKIDIDGMASDMQMSGEIHIVPADDGGVWIFNGG